MRGFPSPGTGGAPLRGAGKIGEGRWLAAPPQGKTPFRRRVKLRYIRDALRGRASLIPLRCPLAHRRGIAISGPFGSANRAASSKPARFFRRWRRFAAFLFPTKPASLGFCGVPLSEEKENAPFDGVREKGSGGGIPDFVRNARSASYGGFGPVEICGLCLLYSLLTPTELRVPPGCPAVLFCCRTLAVTEDRRCGPARMPRRFLLLPHPGS